MHLSSFFPCFYSLTSLSNPGHGKQAKLWDLSHSVDLPWMSFVRNAELRKKAVFVLKLQLPQFFTWIS